MFSDLGEKACPPTAERWSQFSSWSAVSAQKDFGFRF